MPNEDTSATSGALVKANDSGLIRPVASPEALIEAHKEWSGVINQVLEQDRDYGVIPGTGTKPTLLKPGAERLALAARLSIAYDIVEQEIDHDREVKWTKHNRKWGDKSGTSLGLYRYVVRCRLNQKGSGQLIAEGLASASSMESKYVDRPRDVENVILKMAEKRALVAAVLNALALSDRFTQDVEDMEFPKPGPVAMPQAKPAPEVVHASVVEEDEDGPFSLNPPPAAGPVITFGKNKGTAIADLTPKQLTWYRDYISEKREKDGISRTDEILLQDLEMELSRRGSAPYASGKAPF